VKLSRPSRWLLLHLAEIHPVGVSATNALPCFNDKDQPKMIHVRGLIRRGWAYEATYPDGFGMGIFYLTPKGLDAAKTVR